jgi:hypothetical protein
MKPLKTSALALCLACLFTPLLSKSQTLDPTQVYTTGNIVQNTPQGGPTPWVNGVYQDQLTCWSAGDPGYCGPNAIVRPGNLINFSYGSTYLFQQQAVAAILPNSGTGLQVSGYNFGFTAKNGNGWDDGRTDSLTALVRFWDNTNGKSANNLLYGTSYNLNYKFNWTTFNFSENFTTPLDAPSIGRVQYGFIGGDNNGWAGPYGPEVYNVSFSLKYKVDPCATNVLSSPTCPGYFDAIAKLASVPLESSLTTQPTDVGTIILVDSVLISPTGTYGTVSSAESTPPDGSQPTPAGSPTILGGAINPTQQAAAPQPSATKIGEISDSSGGSKSTVSLSSVLSMISSNQEKTAALEKSVVQSADAQAFSAGETAKSTAEKIAGDAQAQSIAVSNSQATSSSQTNSVQAFGNPMQNGAVSLQGNLQSNTVLNTSRQEQSNASALTGQQSTGTTAAAQQTNSSITKQDGVSVGYQFTIQSPKYEPLKFESSFVQPTTQPFQYQPPIARQEFNVSMVTPMVSYSLVTPTRSTPQPQIEIPSLEGIRFGNKSPVEEAMESRPMIPQTNTGSQQGDSVKRNVQNNEAAGNVSIETISRQPVGYAQYFGMMPDVAFYSPREIYRNQKTVDNVRVMRGLSGGSDRLHQEMINQQYK